mmetsp:Transcript_88260/g.236744  ORF Transcript_88260/g.236744 Transcript_88260/m.236744 type:complete len:243 (+) Transcript_88260:387-1115(+)
MLGEQLVHLVQLLLQLLVLVAEPPLQLPEDPAVVLAGQRSGVQRGLADDGLAKAEQALELLLEALTLELDQLHLRPRAPHMVYVLGAVVRQRLYLTLVDRDAVLPEQRGDLAHDHGDVLREGDEYHRGMRVVVVAEPHLRAVFDADVFQVQGVLLLRAVRALGRRALHQELVANAAADGVVHGLEEPLLADVLPSPRLVHRLQHAVADHGEGELHAAGLEVGVDVLDDMHGRGVDGHHRGHL